jgi:glycosyltransferase involved in cell wall biosynthesis
MPEILKAFPLAALDVVGDGSLLGRLKERAMELGVAESITFHGNLAHAKVLKVLSEAHLFCYPTSASEGFPKVVLEALANGIPVITTRVSVLPQLIAAGCGVLLDSATPDDLVPAVIGALTDETRYTQMSERALEVSKQYSLEAWRDVIGESLTRAWIEPLSTEAESAA